MHSGAVILMHHKSHIKLKLVKGDSSGFMIWMRWAEGCNVFLFCSNSYSMSDGPGCDTLELLLARAYGELLL